MSQLEQQQTTLTTLFEVFQASQKRIEMPTPAEVEELVGRLGWTSEVLLEAVQNSAFPGVSSLLDERVGQLALLQRYGKEGGLIPNHIERLERVLDLSSAERRPMAVKRAVLRVACGQLRGVRREIEVLLD